MTLRLQTQSALGEQIVQLSELLSMRRLGGPLSHRIRLLPHGFGSIKKCCAPNHGQNLGGTKRFVSQSALSILMPSESSDMTRGRMLEERVAARQRKIKVKVRVAQCIRC
jgi:hypothetical protein